MRVHTESHPMASGGTENIRQEIRHTPRMSCTARSSAVSNDGRDSETNCGAEVMNIQIMKTRKQRENNTGRAKSKQHMYIGRLVQA